MSMYGVKIGDKRIGTVMRFESHKPSKRWVAYSIATDDKPGFRTLREASEWLRSAYENAPETAKITRA
jgi:hypothetical protein